MRKRHRKPTYVPTVAEAIQHLSRALGYVSSSGVKVEWANAKGKMVLSFDGLFLFMDSDTNVAQIIQSKDLSKMVEMVAARKMLGEQPAPPSPEEKEMKPSSSSNPDSAPGVLST